MFSEVVGVCFSLKKNEINESFFLHFPCSLCFLLNRISEVADLTISGSLSAIILF